MPCLGDPEGGPAVGADLPVGPGLFRDPVERILPVAVFAPAVVVEDDGVVAFRVVAAAHVLRGNKGNKDTHCGRALRLSQAWDSEIIYWPSWFLC